MIRLVIVDQNIVILEYIKILLLLLLNTHSQRKLAETMMIMAIVIAAEHFKPVFILTFVEYF